MNIISFRFEGVLSFRYIKFSQYHNFQTASQRSNPVLFCLILVQNNKNQTVHVFMASCCKSNDLWSPMVTLHGIQLNTVKIQKRAAKCPR